MKTRLSLNLSLLALLLAACAPNTSPPPAAPTEPPLVSAPTATPLADIPSPTLEVAAVTQAVEPTALPIATSRGPNLEATDPLTVSLASGQIHFVEFFRFT